MYDSRLLHVQWMIDGPGGYVNRRLTVRIPSVYQVMLFLTLLTLLVELWQLCQK